MATEIVKTITPSGQGGDYYSLTAWEAGQQTNLVTGDNIAKAVISGVWDKPENMGSTVFDINGWVTSPDNYIQIYVDPSSRHSTGVDISNYIIQFTGGLGRVRLSETDVRLEGLTVYTPYVGIGTSLAGLTGNLYLKDCYVYNTGTQTCYDIGAVASGSYASFINCVAINRGNTASNRGFYINNSGVAAKFYNCTAIVFGNNTPGFIIHSSHTSKICEFYNCLVYSHAATKRSFTLTTGQVLDMQFCASNDEYADDITPINNYVNQNFSFVDSGNCDYRLTISDTGAKDKGTGLSYLFTKDILNNIRNGLWDIGAYEYITIEEPGPSGIVRRRRILIM